ncbi:3-hexulose-6-phosphate synthase [Clostridium sp. DJ247]|uniref:3-hexulose-6-phosphate synthase n=1 Tax=Clostridium sp. DJ247 TaxID=2726188 RepID=UPI001623C178|nr:3-hexulose-6-phosphate synthase [Clostridium sp. DJ247]MBC2581887.1 3-hexulose-6-phosphate synthase [Clostridium sp. DJ247]
MNTQLALDRLSIEEAINIGKKVQDYIDWIEVGTSLIKEFGVESIIQIRKAFPNKIILADVKTFDNAKYEFEMCFKAGADVATVMGAAPKVSIDTCIEIASKYKKNVMIDLLNTSEEQVQALLEFKDAIFCSHVSKDQQEVKGEKQEFSRLTRIQELLIKNNAKIAFAGGIDIDAVKSLNKINPYVVIVGSTITKAEDPILAAKLIQEVVKTIQEV